MAATSKKRFQSWQLTGKGKIVGVFPIATELQPEDYTELELEKDLVVGVKEFFEGHKEPLVRKPTYDPKNRLQHSDYTDPVTGTSGRNLYEYDSRGCICARREQDPKGNLRIRFEVRCDDQGRFVEEKLFNKADKLQERHVYAYDSKGNVLKDEKFAGPEAATLEGFATFVYDEKNRIKRRGWHGPDGKERTGFAYQYDAHDRRVEIAIETEGVRTVTSRISYDARGKRSSTEFLEPKGIPFAREKRQEGGTQKRWLAPAPDGELDPKAIALLNGEALKDLAGVTPAHLEALAKIAYSYFEQGRFAQARALYEALATLDPKDPAYPAGAGAAALSLEQPEVALVWYERALSRAPDHSASLIGRAEVHLQMGNIDQALECFKQGFTHAKSAGDPAVRRARAILTALSQAKPK